jgi:predicted outer membrane repeat protein
MTVTLFAVARQLPSGPNGNKNFIEIFDHRIIGNSLRPDLNGDFRPGLSKENNMKRIVLLLLTLAIVATPAFAAAPGISACKLSACPAGAAQVSPGQSIQAAINAAANGAKICVKPGTYTGILSFMGKRITLVSSGGPSATILNGAGAGSVVSFINFEAADSVLDGFTITNGRAPFGGGLRITSASPTVRNCIIKNNTATGATYSRGGGAFVGGSSSRPLVTCVQFAFNQATYAGGGLGIGGSADVYLRTDDFEQNTAPYGGAVAVYSSGRLDVGTTTFINNRAAVDGGGIHSGVTYGNALVRNSCFRTNRAGGSGGGVWVPAGLAQVLNSTFDGNQASTGGGIAAGFGSMVDVNSTIFVNNQNAALVNASPSNTSVVNHFNDFFNNVGSPAYQATYGDLGLLALDPRLGADCCPLAGSPVLGAGDPDFHFNNVGNGQRNDMGACGGPAI